mgnify:CR=1 FL=1
MYPSQTNSEITRIKPLYRGTQIVWYILGIIEVLLAFRFVLRLLGANAAAGFTQFIYAASWPFYQPFLNVFRSTRAAGSVFEWTTLLAMAVYLLVAWGIVRIFTMSKPVSVAEADQKLREQGP